MKRLVILSVCVLVLSIAGSMTAFAQSPGKTLNAEIAFPFIVGDAQFDAGSYRIELVTAKPAVLTIRPASGGKSVRVPIVTRLAQAGHASNHTEADLVFDDAGNDKYLSEVWLPELDGFLVKGAPEDHKHEVVKVKM